MKNSEIFSKAADLIRTKGFNKGKYEDSQGRLCILGAISKSCGRSIAYGTRGDWENLLIPLETIAGTESLPYWNDDRNTTKEDVLSVLDAAASMAMYDEG